MLILDFLMLYVKYFMHELLILKTAEVRLLTVQSRTCLNYGVEIKRTSK